MSDFQLFIFQTHTARYLFIFSLLLLSSAVPAQIDYSFHSNYHFLKGKDASSIGTGWMNYGYDDSGWATGMAPLRGHSFYR